MRQASVKIPVGLGMVPLDSAQSVFSSGDLTSAQLCPIGGQAEWVEESVMKKVSEQKVTFSDISHGIISV